MGVLDRQRRICVSVTIFSGIRLRMAMRSGRMRCVVARCSVITKMFSLSRTARAGRLSGIFIGKENNPLYNDECSKHRNLRRVSKRSGIIYIITAIAENSKVKENCRKMKKVVDRRGVPVVFY